MKKFLALMLVGVLAFTSSGCTGSFLLTRKVYDFHREQDGKWMDEVVFLGCIILPVYSLAMLGDGIIFNSIEFWTAENPLNEAKVVGDDNLKVTMTKKGDVVEISSADASFTMEKTAEGVIARDDVGTIIYKSVADSKGGVDVYDGQDRLVRHFSVDDAEALKM